MGIFRKKRLPRSEAAMAEAQHQFVHRRWKGTKYVCREYEQLPQGEGAMEAELLELRREKRKMWTMRELDLKKSQDEVTSKRTRHSAT
ncbi:hypothetical protein R1sor_006989 [Riccia sorocarpa]|uniref:Uncharacterized protein n=1 Tax=Riccia sorocarpa TaxID=122646 RepID=A0ABD3HPL0_9MARC